MIAAAELAALMRSAAPHAVLDLREKGAYERSHIFRATSLPRRLLEFRLPGLVTATATPIVIYDEDGRLAELAAPTLRELGYTDVRRLAGGLAAWRAAGRPVVQGINVPSKVFGERMLHEMKTPQLPPHELAGRIERGEDLIIVDSRTPEEYARGCIPGAVSVPGGELVLRIGELVERPETTIVVHCGGRTRSYIGAESLRTMRLANPVVALENGTMGWELAGLTLERGAARWAPPVTAKGKALAESTAERVAAEEGIRSVSPDELRALQAKKPKENLYVLDVRTADEYAAGHLPGAVWAPGGQAVQATDEYVAVRAAAIVLVCDGFVRSVMTAAWLRRLGFPNVAVLAGGLPAWAQARGAVDQGQPVAIPAGYEAARRSVAHAKPGDLGGALVLNVDQSDVYARGHVPGAGWLCRSRLELKIAEIAPDKSQPVAVTCADGYASTLAAATLGRLGYGRTRVLEGGTGAWERAGLPVERGRTRLLDTPDDVVLKPYERGREAMERYLRWEEDLDEQGRSPNPLL
ncbi:MAG: sulfurtransferase [Candidatus Rokubacteria bacterium]|nr:sulfurtransferase [Candidatus Rokubacteria bacterium]